MSMYIDIDSSYRNRTKNPNPANFEVVHKQDTTCNSSQVISPCSTQMVIYPKFQTPSLFFYYDLDQKVQTSDYLPYMYRTNDPHIIRLDELSIRPTNPSDVGEIIVDELYPNGSIPLGQANEFYTDDYLEHAITRETRKIVSFSYTKGSFVLQTLSVLWATTIGDVFKVGVSPASSVYTPPSNIYNLYRGKTMKFITGNASGRSTLITDYTIQNTELYVFTLKEYPGSLPEYGDVFQITSSKEWLATIEYPFSSSLSEYPGYTDPIPDTAQFSLQVIYTGVNTITDVAFNQQFSIAFAESTSTDLKDIYTIESLNSDINFWGVPVLSAQTSTYGLNYTVTPSTPPSNVIYYGVISSNIFSLRRYDVVSDIEVLNQNVSSCPDKRYIGQVHVIYKSDGQAFVAYVGYTTTYSLYVYSSAGSVLSATSATGIVIHMFDKLPDENWVITYATVNSSNKLVQRIITQTPTASDIIIFVDRTFDSSVIDLFALRSIKSYLDRSGTPVIYTPVYVFAATKSFRLVQSVLRNNTSWSHTAFQEKWLDIPFYSYTSVEQLGIIPMRNADQIYMFNWVNNTLSYLSVPFDAYIETAVYNTPIISDYTFHSLNIQLLDDEFVIAGSVTHEGNPQVIVLSQQTNLLDYTVPYRIRKNPSTTISTKVGLDQTISRIVLTDMSSIQTSTGVKDVFYTSYTWFYIEYNMTGNAVMLYSSKDTKVWTNVTILDLPISDSILDIRYICDYVVKQKDIDVLNAYQDKELRYKNLYGDIAWLYVTTAVGTRLLYQDAITSAWKPINFAIPIQFMASTNSTYYSDNVLIPIKMVTSYNNNIYVLERIKYETYNVTIMPASVTFIHMTFTGTRWIAITSTTINTTTDLIIWTPVYSSSEILKFIAWSDELKCALVITTTNILYSFDLVVWGVAFTFSGITDLKWVSHYEGFIGISGNQLLYSSNAREWIVHIMNKSYTRFTSIGTTIGLVRNDGIDFKTLQIVNTTDRFEVYGVDASTLVSQYMWLYNRNVPYDSLYTYMNEAILIISYDPNTNQVILNKVIDLNIPFRIWFEVLADVIDLFNGLNCAYSFVPDKCYTLSLEHIILPNKVLTSYLGNQVSFYPYIYIRVSNTGKQDGTTFNFMTNNPAATTFTFKIPVSQFTNDPSALPYIRLSSSMRIKSRFNPLKPFSITVFLPNGEVFQTLETDNPVPDYPNPLLQVSVLLKITE